MSEKTHAEVFLLALDGLLGDEPTSKVLEQRTRILAARFGSAHETEGRAARSPVGCQASAATAIGRLTELKIVLFGATGMVGAGAQREGDRRMTRDLAEVMLYTVARLTRPLPRLPAAVQRTGP
jgi:hypothetical protein